MSAIRKQIKKIEVDILRVLNTEQKPLTQDQLFDKTKLKNMSEYGWSFALTNLERSKTIRMNDDNEYELIKRKQDA